MRLWESSAPAEKETGKGLPSQSLALARFAGRYPSRPSIAAHRAVLSRLEGIIPALESSHAVAYLLGGTHGFAPDRVVVLNLSGRGDKDVYSVAERLGVRS